MSRADSGAGEAAPDGILLVDKPSGPTSHDIVARMRRLAGTRKVGHAGTLDPMASGLLVVGIGASTRLLTFVVGTGKEYLATIRLGHGTTTDDAEGEALPAPHPERARTLDEESIRAALTGLTGTIAQVPSSVSAIKVDGKRAYARVRAGEEVRLAAREVTIEAIDVLGLRRGENGEGVPLIDLEVRVDCSSGTYVRAIARDLGAALGVGGHLTALRRTAVGPFSVGDAATPDALAEDGVATRMLAPAEAAARLFPTVRLTEEEARDLGDGKRPAPGAGRLPAGRVAALAPDGRLVGIAEPAGERLRVVVNFPTPASSPRAAHPHERGSEHP